MQKKILVTAIAGLLAGVSATASAAGGVSPDAKGINVSLENSLFDFSQMTVWRGKFFTGPDMAILAGAGFNTYGGDADGTDLSLSAGARKYVGTGSFAPFFGGSFTYESIESGMTPEAVFGNAGNIDKVTTVGLVGEFGAEYFFSPQFSVEGALRAGFSSSDIDFIGGGNNTVTRFGTFGSQVSVNYYF
jgi:hypothetical protein